MASIEGKYKLEKSEKFDEFLDKLGVGFMVKTAAKTLKPTFEVAKENDQYVFRSLSTFKNTEIKFKLGEEFEEDRADGKRVKTVINKDGDNKFVQTQFGDKEVKIVREFNGDEVVVVSSALLNFLILTSFTMNQSRHLFRLRPVMVSLRFEPTNAFKHILIATMMDDYPVNHSKNFPLALFIFLVVFFCTSQF